MVEMNRRPSARSGRRQRLRSLSPTPPPRSPKPAPTTPQPQQQQQQQQQPAVTTVRSSSPNGENSVGPSKDTNDINDSESSSETERNTNSKQSEPPTKPEIDNQLQADSIVPASESSNSLPERPVVRPSAPEPFTSSSLPEDRNNSKSPVDKVQQLSRKRERTPSPTFSAPYPKRHALGSDGLPLMRSSRLPSGGGSVSSRGGANHSMKGPSPVPGVVVSASKVLGEEIQKQQGQDNARLKMLIHREVRKPGKSEFSI